MTRSGSPSPGAERTRLYRERRRKGLRCIAFEIRETEITALIARGLLAPADRDNSTEVCRALGRLLDATL